MKKLRAFSSCVCLLFAAFTANAGDAFAVEANTAQRVLRVSIDSNYPPYAFLDSNGALIGYSVDLWGLWEKKTGTQVELVAENLEDAIAAVTEGRVDLVDTVFRNKPRERFLTFSKSYASIPVSLYTHSSLNGIVGIESLPGFVIGVKAGDACIEKLESAGIRALTRYHNYEDLVHAAQAEQIKVFCMDEPAANYLLYKASADRQFRRAFQTQVGELHRAVLKSQEKMLAEIDAGFDRVSASERMTLDEKWMGRAFPPTLQERYLVALVIGVLISGSVLAVFGWRIVRRRTEELKDEQNHMRTLVRTLPDMVWLKSPAGVVLACNPALSELYGIREEDIVGKTDYELLDKEIADSFRQSDLAAIAAGKACFNEEWFYSNESAQRRLFETIKAPMYNKHDALVGVLGIARDITERRQTENALRASEQKFAAAFRSSPDAIIISQAWDGRIIEVNEAFVRLSGYAREELIGRNGLELNLWGDNNRRNDCFSQLLEKGWLREVEGDFRIKSGELRSALTSGEVVQIDARPHILWVVRDITERRRMEDALRSSEQKFAAAFHSSPNALVLYRITDEQVVDLNDAFVRLSGFSRDEMIGRNGLDIGIWLDESVRAQFLLRVRREHRVSDVEALFQDKAGCQRICLISGEAFQVNGIEHLLWVVRDVTERRRAEDALRVSEQKFAAAFRACPDASVITEFESRRIVDINDAMIRLTGYDREEMIGASAIELEAWMDPMEQNQYLTGLREQGRVVGLESSFRMKMGETRVGILFAELIVVDGRSHVLTIFHDNTLRCAMEKKLEKANIRLKALSSSLLEIQEDERRNLAHELHDEIGQSLTAQKIALQSLCIRPDARINCEQIRKVINITDTVLSQVRRISLDLRPPQLDDLGLPAAIRWNLLRQSELAGFVPHFSASGTFSRLPESIAIACYRISQEALTNAIRHGLARTIWISLECDGSDLQLEIRDDGEGFDPSSLEDGKSMGMIGMQERATLAGGQLSACAQPGAGCTIAARFPL